MLCKMKNPVELKRYKTLSFYKGLITDETKTSEGEVIFNFGI